MISVTCRYISEGDQLVELRLTGELVQHLGRSLVPLQRVHHHDGERKPGGPLQR
jgi:hypothetical protein